MIQANELRIGNYLKSDVVVKIDARTIFDIWDNSKKYEPILITKEYLERFGFEIKKGNREDHFTFSKNYLSGHFYKKKGYYFKNIYSDIKYVHQLQNLYFALSGKELTLND